MLKPVRHSAQASSAAPRRRGESCRCPWSPGRYRTAFTHPEFKASLAAYASSVVATPHLFQKVAAPGICVA